MYINLLKKGEIIIEEKITVIATCPEQAITRAIISSLKLLILFMR